MEGTRKSKMLIVDDDQGMRHTLRRIMLAKEFDVAIAESGEEALSVAADYQPDVVLMDMKMPGMNGVETLREMKLICPNIVSVFMTAFSSVSLKEEASREGAIRVMSKPVDVDSLLNLINNTKHSAPVLLIDDDAGFRTSLQRALEANGFRVKTAACATAALEEFRSDPDSVVLLDMKLNGGASGLDLLQQIQKVNTNVMVVLMTGFLELEPLMADGMRFGAHGTLVKPFDVDVLVEKIRPKA